MSSNSGTSPKDGASVENARFIAFIFLSVITDLARE